MKPVNHMAEFIDEWLAIDNKPKQTYRFEELSDTARWVARSNYRDGWLATHPEEADEYVNDDSLVSEDGNALFSIDGRVVTHLSEFGQTKEPNTMQERTLHYRQTIAVLQSEVIRLKELLAEVKTEADDIVNGLIENKEIVSHYGCSCCMPSRDFKNADSVSYCRLQEIVRLVSPESYKLWEDEEDRSDHIAYKEFQSAEDARLAEYDKD